MSLGGVFMMLSCFVMRVFCHNRCPLESIFDSLNTKQVMNHRTLSSAHPLLLVIERIVPVFRNQQHAVYVQFVRT
jgi:hypothetical protein